MKHKRCSKCGEEKRARDFCRRRSSSDGLNSQCRQCVFESSRQRQVLDPEGYRAMYRAKNKRYLAQGRASMTAWRKANPEKVRAHDAVAWAIKTGRLARAPCEVRGCGGVAEAHHDDYSKPLDVRWLCRRHHRELHARQNVLRGTRGAA